MSDTKWYVTVGDFLSAYAIMTPRIAADEDERVPKGGKEPWDTFSGVNCQCDVLGHVHTADLSFLLHQCLSLK